MFIQIATLQTQVGLAGFQSILENVDSDIIKNLKDYINLWVILAIFCLGISVYYVN